MPAVLRSAGLKVAEVPGWLDRGRREMGRIEGVICHHTATTRDGNMPSLRTLMEGRSDLPGPLSQLGLARDGTYYIIAAGRCNHAGGGEGHWRRVDGNSHYIGIEAENRGRGEDWPQVQMDAYVRGVAAILKHVGSGVDRCCGHKEYAPSRKPDPSFDMALFRARVSAIMNGTGAVRPLIPPADNTGRPTLRRGDRGDHVRFVQQKLGLVGDGKFGPMTEATLRTFQRAHDLVPDGIVGPRTWAKLDST
jgi:peptidoglycan hydrolase-like protein with peptidoglycan-binding domain